MLESIRTRTRTHNFRANYRLYRVDLVTLKSTTGLRIA